MATAKEEVLEILSALPDDATLEDVQYSIYVRERIKRGIEEAAAGNVISQEEAERRTARWIVK